MVILKIFKMLVANFDRDYGMGITKCINQYTGTLIFSYGSNCYEKENPNPLILLAAVIIMISLFSLTNELGWPQLCQLLSSSYSSLKLITTTTSVLEA